MHTCQHYGLCLSPDSSLDFVFLPFLTVRPADTRVSEQRQPGQFGPSSSSGEEPKRSGPCLSTAQPSPPYFALSVSLAVFLHACFPSSFPFCLYMLPSFAFPGYLCPLCLVHLPLSYLKSLVRPRLDNDVEICRTYSLIVLGVAPWHHCWVICRSKGVTGANEDTARYKFLPSPSFSSHTSHILRGLGNQVTGDSPALLFLAVATVVELSSTVRGGKLALRA